MIQHEEFHAGTSFPWGEDYESAVVHLAVWQTRTTSRFLFGTIEFVPRGVVVPASDVVRIEEYAPGKSFRTVRGRCSIEVALRLREQFATAESLDIEAALGVGFRDLGVIWFGATLEEPAWPCVVLHTSDLPFLATWHGQPRLHHILPATPFTDLDPLERDRVQAWVSACFFFVAEDYPEYLGSLHLIAPNPRYRELMVRRVPRPSSDAPEGVALVFRPRPGDDLRGLQVRVCSVRPTGRAWSRWIEVRVPMFVVEFDHALDRVALEVFDPQRGVLEKTREFLFWSGRSHVRTELVQPSGVPRAGSASFDELLTRSAAVRIEAGEALRREKRGAGAYRLFGLDHAATWQVAREEILRDGHRFMLVVAPRLDARDLEVLRTWSRDGAYHLFALTAEAPDRVDLPVADLHTEHRYVELRTMSAGRRVHGGFIAGDNHTWMFSGLPADLGRRGSFLMEIPYARALREQLFDAWHASGPSARIAAVADEIFDPTELLGATRGKGVA